MIELMIGNEFGEGLKSVKQRKKRADAGKVRLTERDLFLLRWMGEMYGIRFDHLRILAGRYSERGTRNEKHVLSDKGARRLLKRLIDGELVQAEYIIVGHPQWIWPTEKGLALAGLNYPYWEARKDGGVFRHKHAVNGVRLFLEEQGLKGQYMPYRSIPWISDRQVNVERKLRGKRHIVDGELLVKEIVVAIEVELTVKSYPRLRSILNELSEDYAAVWYFVSMEAQATIESALERFEGNLDKFKLYPLPEYSEYYIKVV